MEKVLNVLRYVRNYFGISGNGFKKWSINRALKQRCDYPCIEKLRNIVPDISSQYSLFDVVDEYNELKIRGMHAFQCRLMTEALRDCTERALVVDVGDSAGTHMLYIKSLLGEKINLDTISVNLDPEAIERIQKRGLQAVMCRAEDMSTVMKGKNIDLLTAFEVVEHLHNPALFFRNMAVNGGDLAAITVPYRRRSRVALQPVRMGIKKDVSAEGLHVFELCPDDWTTLMLHSGWRVIKSDVHYQYPRGWPIISRVLGRYWDTADFEGFWGAILQRDTTYMECYRDWEN